MYIYEYIDSYYFNIYREASEVHGMTMTGLQNKFNYYVGVSVLRVHAAEEMN